MCVLSMSHPSSPLLARGQLLLREEDVLADDRVVLAEGEFPLERPRVFSGGVKEARASSGQKLDQDCRFFFRAHGIF